MFNNTKFVIRIKEETGCHQLADENCHPKYFILSPGSLPGCEGGAESQMVPVVPH